MTNSLKKVKLVFCLFFIFVVSSSITANVNTAVELNTELVSASNDELVVKDVIKESKNTVQDGLNLVNTSKEINVTTDQFLNDLSPSDQEIIKDYVNNVKGLSKLNETFLSAYNELFKQLETETQSDPLTISTSSDYEGAFESIIFNSWSDTSTECTFDQSNVITNNDNVYFSRTVEGDRETVIKRVLTENYDMTERNVISGKERVILDDATTSRIDNLSIPVLSRSEVSSEPITINEKFYVPIGFSKELKAHEIDLDLEIKDFLRFKYYLYVSASFHFTFPVNLYVSYPSFVISGERASIKCHIEPLDIIDYNETEFNFVLKNSMSLHAYNLIPETHYKTKTLKEILLEGLPLPESVLMKYTKSFLELLIAINPLWPFLKQDYEVPYTVYRGEWQPIVEYDLINIDHQVGKSYKTPMRGESRTIPWDEYFNILPFLVNVIPPIPIPVYPWTVNALISEFFYFGVSPGELRFDGGGIYGQLDAKVGNLNPMDAYYAVVYGQPYLDISKGVKWDDPLQEKTVSFLVPTVEQESQLSFAFSKLYCILESVEVTPKIKYGFKDWTFPVTIMGMKFQVPITKYLPQTTATLGTIPLGTWWVPSTFSYTRGFKTTIIPEEQAYDCSMVVRETTPYLDRYFWQKKPTDRTYRISLQNKYGTLDTVKLVVTGLPTGFTATFDRSLPFYQLGSVPITASLHISAPKNYLDPPGEHEFHISAISIGKIELGLTIPEASVTEHVTLTIPEIIDHRLNLGSKTVPPVSYGETVNIDFYGTNLGNVGDTVNVKADLCFGRWGPSVRSWDENFILKPLGSSQDTFSGEFSFSYSKDDLFPRPGRYTLLIESTSQSDPNIRKKIALPIELKPACGLELSITPTHSTIFANWKQDYTLTIKNTGNCWDTYTLTSTGWDQYISYPSKVYFVGSQETRKVQLSLEIADPRLVPEGSYTFRVTATSNVCGDSSIFASSDAVVKILPADLVPPGIDYYGPVDSDLVVPQSSLSLGPVWTAFDNYPSTYEVFINETSHTSGSWVNGDIIHVPVTGPTNPLEPGRYNVTITFYDQVGNVASSQTWVTVTNTDNTVPLINTIVDQVEVPENYHSSIRLYWNYTEEFPLNVTLFRNGEAISVLELFVTQDTNNSAQWEAVHIIEPGSLAVGTYNCTLYIQDACNNVATSQINITILPSDHNLPEFTQLPVSSAPYGGDETFSITAVDANPDKYQLFINSTLLYNGTWQSGIPIAFNVDELAEDLFLEYGDNDIELRFYDIVNNSNTHKWTFSLLDVNAPTIIMGPTSYTIAEHENTADNVPSWSLNDNDGRFGRYSIYRNSLLVSEGSWNNGNGTIHVPVAGVPIGEYQIEAYFEDASENTYHSTIIVTVVDGLAPYIFSVDPIRFEPLYTPSWFELFIIESYPSEYSLYRNGTLIEEKSIIGDDDPITLVDLEGLATGYYEYMILVTDKSGNINNQTIQVWVTDYIAPYVKRPVDIVFVEGTSGHNITWEILEANLHNYSIYRNGELIDNGTFHTTNLSIMIDDLEKGNYTYVFLVYDESGLSHTCTSYVTVVDITAPLINHLSDCRFVMNSDYAELIWEARDLHPASYRIKLNSVDLVQSDWNNEDITLSMIGWSAGTYTVELNVIDTSGNVAMDEVYVTIVDSEETTVITEIAFKPSTGFTVLFALVGIVILSIRLEVKRREDQ